MRTTAALAQGTPSCSYLVFSSFDTDRFDICLSDYSSDFYSTNCFASRLSVQRVLSFLWFFIFFWRHGTSLIDRCFDSRRLILLCISVGLVYLLDFYFAIGLLLFLNVCFILDLMSSSQVYERVYKRFVLVTSVCFLAVCLKGNFPISRVELLHQDQQAPLYEWVRTHTDKDALFVVPVDRVTQFRLFAQRAILIDWKGCPYFPSEYDVWLKRLQDVTASTELSARRMRDQGYRKWMLRVLNSCQIHTMSNIS